MVAYLNKGFKRADCSKYERCLSMRPLIWGECIVSTGKRGEADTCQSRQLSASRKSRYVVSRVMCRRNFKRRCLSFIYVGQLPADFSSLPPGNGRAALDCRCIWPCNTWDVRPPVSPSEPVGSYPTFSPLPLPALPDRGGCFLSLILDVAADFPLGSMPLCVARTFLCTRRCAATDRVSAITYFIFCAKFIIISATAFSDSFEESRQRW